MHFGKEKSGPGWYQSLSLLWCAVLEKNVAGTGGEAPCFPTQLGNRLRECSATSSLATQLKRIPV